MPSQVPSLTQPERVTPTDLRRVADLANLDLTADEEKSLLHDLNSILDQVDQLKELDTSTVPAMAQVAEVLENAPDPAIALRADVVAPSLNRDLVMAAAPDSDGVYFRVPKVIER